MNFVKHEIKVAPGFWLRHVTIRYVGTGVQCNCLHLLDRREQHHIAPERWTPPTRPPTRCHNQIELNVNIPGHENLQ
jgi:hypothetical protein